MRRSVWIGFAFAATAALVASTGAFAQAAATVPAPADAAAPAADAAAPAVKKAKKTTSAAKATATDAATSDAAPAADKPKAEKASKATVALSVLNKRTVALKMLTVIPTGGDGDPKKVIGAVKPGKRGVARVARTKDCQYDLHGDFDDGSVFEASGVDLCKSSGFNLVD
jgi:hypothetical protein